MKNFLQIVFCFLACSLLVMPHLWVGAAFQYRQYQFTASLAQRMESEKGGNRIRFFVFDKTEMETGKLPEFTWRNATEFTFEGVFFDLLESKTVDNQLHITAFADFEETVYHNKQEEIWVRLWNSQNNDRTSLRFIKLLNTSYVIHQNYPKLLPPLGFSLKLSHSFIPLLYSNRSLDTPKKPPETFTILHS